MNIEKTIQRTVHVVDRCLRKTFPTDYDARCLYAARAIEALLNDNGIIANMCGGNVAMMMVSSNLKQVGFQGFAGASETPSHYWVSVGKTIIDVGPTYLSSKSSFPALNTPFISWLDENSLPKYLRYKKRISYPPLARLDTTADIEKRMENFLEVCQFANIKGNPKLTNWVLQDESSLQTAAKRGDPWASNIIMFLNLNPNVPIPF